MQSISKRNEGYDREMKAGEETLKIEEEVKAKDERKVKKGYTFLITNLNTYLSTLYIPNK